MKARNHHHNQIVVVTANHNLKVLTRSHNLLKLKIES